MQPNRYRLTEKIAQGGCAEVYRAEHRNNTGFQRTVAVKRILPQHMGSRSHQEMLISEAKLLVALNHPNIVQVYDLGCSNGSYFFVMEYVDGCDLRRVLQWHQERQQPIALDCAVLIAIEIAKALDYAHTKTDAKGQDLFLVHQDISPKNVLLSRSGEVKLTDFGIARVYLPCVDPQGVVRGKFAYMSPEQALGKPLDARSDLFSLGLVLYEMLSGQALYRSQKLTDLQREHFNHRAHAPLLDCNIPAELEYILLRCLAYDCQERYDSARSLREDLTRFLFQELQIIPHHQLNFLVEEVESSLPRGFGQKVPSQALLRERKNTSGDELPTVTSLVANA